MGFGFARAQRDAYLLSRMEAQEAGQWIALDLKEPVVNPELDLEPEHRHGEGCACQLRGE